MNLKMYINSHKKHLKI